MGKLLLSLCFLFTFSILKSQTFEIIEGNNTSARVQDNGLFFYDNQTGFGHYYVPKDAPYSSILAGGFWFMGHDLTDTLRAALMTYNLGNDFFRGPYSSNNSYFDQNYIDKYNPALWNISKTEIDYHRNNYWQAGYEIPLSVANWPANGDDLLGVSMNLAPFIDLNQNGIYEPLIGEYPDIRGDHLLYIIMNDARGIHTESSGAPLHSEFHFMVYQYESEDEFLNNSTFINVRVFNRGITTIRNLKIGFFTDVNLGRSFGNYFGSDSTRNMGYVYKATNFDDSLGSNPPAIGLMALGTSATSIGLYGNLSVPFPYEEIPALISAWGMMNSNWNNGLPYLYGGGGYEGSIGVTDVPTNYLFSGDPELGTGWTELNAQTTPSGRRPLIILDSVFFEPGMVYCTDWVILYSRTGDHIQNVSSLKLVADSLIDFYLSQEYSCQQVTLGLSQDNYIKLKIFPNPNNGKFFVELPDGYQSEEIIIRDLKGSVVCISAIDNDKNQPFEVNLENGVYFISVGVNSNVTRVVIVN